MKRFDFRRELKGKSLQQLKSLRKSHVNWVITFAGLNDKEATKHNRYVSYIDQAIERLKN